MARGCRTATALLSGLLAGALGARALAASAPAPIYHTYTVGQPAEHQQPLRPPGSAQDQADMQLRPLVASGAAPSVTTGLAAKGAAFFSVGVKHGVTGALTSDVTGRGWFLSNEPLRAGQPVYGIPMSGSAGLGIVWCAPKSTLDGGVTHWSAVCLPQNDGAYAWIEAQPALLALDLDWAPGLPHVASAPSVARGPQTFPPMTLSYAFEGYDKQHWYQVRIQIDWGEGPQTLRQVSVPPAADGSASLKVMGGQIVLRPASKSAHGDDQVTVEATTPPDPAAPIAY